jgi:HlyD family secretion protein
MRLRPLLLWSAILATLAGGFYLLFKPQAIEVELVEVRRDQFKRVVADEGRTRVKNRYLVSAPVSGRLARPAVKVGDHVNAGDTLLTLLPHDPALLDRRTSASLTAHAEAARAALERARADSARARAAETLARSEALRAAGLAGRGFVSESARENAELTLREREQARIAAEHAETAAGFELRAALAALQRAGAAARSQSEEAWVVLSPITGQVLRLVQESEQAVSAGAPLVELGDIRQLEVVVDVLSAEAAGVRPGQSARLTLTRGAPPLEGQVRRVEPVAHTRVSALGIDEQRVPVLIDLPAEMDVAPGDGWRVDAAIVVDARADVLVLPAGALIRERGRWRVFVATGDTARVRSVSIGGLTSGQAWITDGLTAGDQVVLHPPDGLVDGSPIRVRQKNVVR